MNNQLIVDIFKHDRSIRFLISLLIMSLVGLAIDNPWSIFGVSIYSLGLGYKS